MKNCLTHQCTKNLEICIDIVVAIKYIECKFGKRFMKLHFLFDNRY